ncbi:hypothetical protein J2W42_006288 [Rhizobium tibeticum]|nr:hypothetical protein [Rhizobium tibeticum]
MGPADYEVPCAVVLPPLFAPARSSSDCACCVFKSAPCSRGNGPTVSALVASFDFVDRANQGVGVQVTAMMLKWALCRAPQIG